MSIVRKKNKLSKFKFINLADTKSKNIEKADIASNKISIALLSDLHAFDEAIENEQVPSYLNMSIPHGLLNQHPLSGLFSLIDKNQLRADIVLCAGDLGDKAKTSAIQYAWVELNALKERLKANQLIAAPGNHDFDSRSMYCEYDPKGSLQTLAPSFPFEDERLNNKFWSSNYAIIEKDNYKIVVFNSSAFHGINDEFKHGRISPLTLAKLKDELSQTKKYPINIFICHHHPQKIENIKLNDYEVMAGGQSLLEFLGSGDVGDWLFIHGHKHFPKLTYAAGNSIGPAVFSLGSLSAILDSSISTNVTNQFYMLHFDLDHIKQFGFVGTFEAWDWHHGYGWDNAESYLGLPSHGGFGYRANPRILAQKIAEKVGNTFLEWKDLASEIPELAYLTPGDLTILCNDLELNYSLNIIKNHGKLNQIGKKL